MSCFEQRPSLQAMSERRPATQWSAPAIALLTLLWLGSLLVLVLLAFSIGMESWAGRHSAATMAEIERLAHQSSLIVLCGGILLFAGPLAIATTAFAGRRPWAAGVYGVLGVLAFVPGVLSASGAYREMNPPAPERPGRYVCQEHSGEGGFSCPGG